MVLLGVRMFIGEMVPAFNGIGSRLVPGAKPALDCPILFNFAPNAVVLGFVGAFVGSLLWLTVIGRSTGYVYSQHDRYFLPCGYRGGVWQYHRRL